MNISKINNNWSGAYKYAKTSIGKTSFAQQLQKTAESENNLNVESYEKYLKSKYGNVLIQDVGKDKYSLDKIGKSMSGSNVVIAPNILEQMANDPSKTAYYEKKIDDFFNATPKLKAQFAAKGLDYQPCGVVVHKDGSVTYIGGCGDSPERVAEVNAINKAKREKKAAQRKANLERSVEMKEQIEKIYNNLDITDFLANQPAELYNFIYEDKPIITNPIIEAYSIESDVFYIK